MDRVNVHQSHLTLWYPLFTDPFSVQPSSPAPPVAGEPFSLRCVGTQDPASITWLKNSQQILASERVHFSSDNATVMFSPVLQADGGLYQCLVVAGGNQTLYYDSLEIVEGGAPILSVGYVMQVNCEYIRVMKITRFKAFEQMICESRWCWMKACEE